MSLANQDLKENLGFEDSIFVFLQEDSMNLRFRGVLDDCRR